ncbi:MAG: carboxyltransferase domain-containing protein [Bacteroidota bacterium]
MSESLQFADHRISVAQFHDDFLILKTENPAVAQQLGRALQAREFDFVREVIATEVEILVSLRRALLPPDWAALQALDFDVETQAPRTFHLPVCFEHAADWAAVCEHAGRTQDEIVAELTKQPFSVAMLGFLPGFCYLNGLPEHLQIPRKAIPATRVPAGSLAIGGKYLGVYALESPGGWQVIGRTPLKLIDFEAMPPVPYLPGDAIRLKRIDKDEYARLQALSMTLIGYHANT